MNMNIVLYKIKYTNLVVPSLWFQSPVVSNLIGFLAGLKH